MNPPTEEDQQLLIGEGNEPEEGE